MLQLYDVNKNKIKGLAAYKDYYIESTLKTGDKVLSFLYPKRLGKEIKNEGYIRNKTDEFVIKSIDNSGDWLSINANLNVENLEGKEWESFTSLEQTIEQCLTLACVGTGWTVTVTGVTKKRTIRMTNCNSWDIIQQARKTYLVEISFDTINRKIIVKNTLGQDKGTYFTDDLNLKKLDISNDSYDFFTRIKPIGKDGLKINVNGKDYLENYQYSNKVKTLIWKDERYTAAESLKEDATIKLEELSKPRVAYAVDIIDLAKLNSKYKNILDYSLGDTIYLVSKENSIREKQRIVKTKEYPDEPERNNCEIANTVLTFEDIQKEYADTTDTVNNITSDNGTVSENAISTAVKNLTVDKVEMSKFTAVEGRVGSLEVNKLSVDAANIKFASIDEAILKKANITDLTATNIKFEVAEGGTLNLQTLLSKFVSGENGQFLNLTSNNVVIATGVIKDAMIDSVNANKINTGTLDTNKVTVQGPSGNLLIKDNTIQIKDNTRVRVQIGKDASNDYNMYVWDATGKLMFDATGLKADGIKSKIIRDDMVSDTANISGSKINISSLITEVNKDTNTQTIKGSKVYLDTIGQSLEVSFNSLKISSDDTKSKTESNTTSIGTINGQIDTLIKDTTIEENGSTIKLKDSYSSLKQTVNGINTTVASHTTSITSLGTNVTNAQNTANSANNLADSKAKVFTATPTTPYKVGDIWTGGPSGELMKCKVARASGNYTASDWEKASKYTDDTKANAVEGKVTEVETKQASLEQNINGFKTTVSNTYSTKTELNTAKTDAINSANSSTDNKLKSYSTTSAMNTAISQSASDITSTVSNTYATKTALGETTTRVESVENKVTATAITTTISNAINAGTNSISTTQFVMDKNGLTIKNGALTIKNKANANVLTSDTNGNLTITGTFINKNNNGVDAIKIDSTNIYFYDWDRNARELGIIYSSFLTDYPNVKGFSFAHNQQGYMTLGYRNGTNSFGSYMTFDKYSINPTYAAPIRVHEGTVFHSAVNMQDRVYIPQAIYFDKTNSSTTAKLFKANNANRLVMEVSVSNVGDGFVVQSNTGGTLGQIRAGETYPILLNNNTYIGGNLAASGSKNSLQTTKNYGERLINAYETAEYYFGDIGSGVIRDSECIVWIDDILQECINTNVEYHVFIQTYNGSNVIIERYKDYFIVFGEDNTKFSWELKAKRLGYENVRLDQPDIEGYLDNTPVFTEEDLTPITSEEILVKELDFKLEDLLLKESA